MSAGPIRIGVPWQAPSVRRFNGDHPLPSSLIHDTRGFVFDRSLTLANKGNLRDAETAAAELRNSLAASSPELSPDEVADLVASRDLASQAMMRAPADLEFLHTAPMTFGRRPWILHFEETVSLFAPYVWHGTSANVDIQAQPVYRLVKHLIDAPECRGVFSHLRHSAECLPLLLDNKALRKKTHYIPLGIEFSEMATRKIAAHQKTRGGAPGTTFLFTNSWSQNESSFILRGGSDVIRAFLELVQKYPNCQLIVMSSLPVSHYGAGFAEFVRGIPNLHVLDRRVSDDELVELMLAADVFLIPSVGLHALSVLRGMYCGLAVVASDAPGNDEFIHHDRTGILVEGRRGKTAWYDEIGFLHQTFEPAFVKQSDEFSIRLFREMEQLHLDPARRLKIGAAAREHVLLHHGMAGWRDGFRAMIDAIRPTL